MTNVVGQSSTLRAQDKGNSNSARSLPCVYFNKAVCLKKQTHETKGVGGGMTQVGHVHSSKIEF